MVVISSAPAEGLRRQCVEAVMRIASKGGDGGNTRNMSEDQKELLASVME